MRSDTNLRGRFTAEGVDTRDYGSMPGVLDTNTRVEGRDFTLEFPTRVISKLLGLPEEDLPWFRKRAVELISYTVKYKRAFEASAALKD